MSLFQIIKNKILQKNPIVENDPFEDLPCVIRCHLTPTPLADENKENLREKIQSIMEELNSTLDLYYEYPNDQESESLIRKIC